MPNTAPDGSTAIANRPSSLASSGPMPTVPPHSRTDSAARSTSSAASIVVHDTGRCGGPAPLADARHPLPSSSASTYVPSCCGPGTNSQPNSAP